MPRWVLIAAGAGLLLLAGGAAAEAAVNPGTRVRVLARDTARGIHSQLQMLLDEWEMYGPFDVTIGNLPGFPGGGLRTSEAGQAAAAAAGLSTASTLASTPHGRGGAIDLWPSDFNPWLSWEQQPDRMKQKFYEIGAFAKARGFVWGGDWRSATFPYGDQPHIEMAGWRMLPFPPPSY